MPFLVSGTIGIRVLADLSTWTELQASADGNCVFNSLGYLLHLESYQSTGLLNYDSDHMKLRKMACDWIQAICSAAGGVFDVDLHTTARRHIIVGADCDPGDPTHLMYDGVIAGYLERMRRWGTWGDDLCILAIERMFNARISVHRRDGSEARDANTMNTGARLRIMFCPSQEGGRICNHYNPLVSTVGEAAEACMSEARFDLALPPPSNAISAYWIDLKQIRPYVRPVHPAQYHLKPPISGSRKTVLAALGLGNKNTVDSAEPLVDRLVLTNRDGTHPDLDSQGFSSSDWPKNPAAHRPRLMLPLADSTDKKSSLPYASFPRLDKTYVKLALKKPSSVTFSLWRPNAAESDAFVAKVVCSLFTLLEASSREPQMSYTVCSLEVPLSAVLSDKIASGLCQEHGPYLLLACVTDPPTNPYAWTYFDVPSPWDVSVIELVARRPFIRLYDDLHSLKGLAIIEKQLEVDAVNPFSPTDGRLAKLIGKGFIESLRASRQSIGLAELLWKIPELSMQSESVVLRREDGRFFIYASWGSVVVCRRIKGAYYVQSLYCAGSRDVLLTSESSTKDAKKYVRKRNGVMTIQNEAGTEKTIKSDWSYHYFGVEDLPLAAVFTSGISSCSGGCTFSAEETPEWVVLWHIDALASVPVKHILAEVLRVFPESTPVFQTFVTLFPSPWELYKYRDENLYPDAVQASCGTVYLARGTHLYGENAISCGHDLLGLQFPGDGTVDFQFTYDLTKRSDGLLPRAYRKAQFEIARSLVDINDDLHGTYRYKDQSISTESEVTALLEMTLKPPSNFLADKDEHGSVLRLPAIGSGLFGKLLAISSTVLDTPCLLAGQGFDLEIGGKIVPGFTFPNPRGSEKEADGEEEEKKLELYDRQSEGKSDDESDEEKENLEDPTSGGWGGGSAPYTQLD